MGLLGNVIGGVIASRMAGRSGPLGGAFGGPMGGVFGGPMGGALGGAVLGGMGRGRRGSPVMTGLMLLLAARAAQSYLQNRQQGQPQGQGQDQGQDRFQAGGLLSGVAAGGGLGALVEQFTRNGHGDAIRSWIQPGPNKPLPPQQLAEALGPDTVQALRQETGLDEDELLSELSETLPEAVDQLSADGVEPDPKILEGDDEDMAIVRAVSV